MRRAQHLGQFAIRLTVDIEPGDEIAVLRMMHEFAQSLDGRTYAIESTYSVIRSAAAFERKPNEGRGTSLKLI